MKPDVPVSESVSILDRLQGTSAANNFNKDDDVFKAKKHGFIEKQLPALKEDKVEARNDGFWMPVTE